MIDIVSVALEALPEGALWWDDEKLLIVADLHFEKGSSFARRGQLLPPYDTPIRTTMFQMNCDIQLG